MRPRPVVCPTWIRVCGMFRAGRVVVAVADMQPVTVSARILNCHRSRSLHLVEQPGPREIPVAFHGCRRDTECSADFFVGESSEEPQLNYLGGARNPTIPDVRASY